MTARVFWTLVVGFLLGVLLCSFIPVSNAFAILLVTLGVAVTLLAFVSKEKHHAGILVAVVLFSSAFGMWRMGSATLSGDPFLSAHLDETLIIEGKVVAEPDVREGSVRLFVEADTVVYESATSSIKAGVLVVVPPHSEVSYGDTIRARGTLRAPESFDTGDGRQFAYPEYLAMRGITHELSRAEIESSEAHMGNPLYAFAIGLKHKFLDGLGAALPEPAAGLAGGITVGDKRSIGEALSEDFRIAGLIHIIVLSGYNITIVLNAAAWLLKRASFLATFRFASLAISGVVVALFVLMTGGASSAVRAGAMAMIGVYARTSGRIFLASRALAAAAILIVLWNPFILTFDPGFQLSVLATLGLIVFTPLFETKLMWIPKKWALREIVASTLGTQLTVLPLLLYQNGQLPIYSLPANFLTLAFMPLAMLFSLIAGVAGIFLGSLAVPIGFPAYVVLEYIISIARIMADLPYASVSIGAFNVGWMIVAYAIIFFIAWRWHKKTAGR